MSKSGISYGVELEFGDCDRRLPLPDGAKWNTADNTCVNSNGIANDPLGKLYNFGGEINTMPTFSIEEQIAHIGEIISATNPTVNYRCNLHIHIGVPSLKNDLDKCKKLFSYFQVNAKRIFELVEPLPELKEKDPEKRKWEKIRLNRIKVSHHYLLPKQRYEAVTGASTCEEFLNEHAPLSAKGRMWYFSPRPAMNMRQLWDTGTVEFRHFPGTLDVAEIESCLRWCEAIVADQPNPNELFNSYPFKFPIFPPYNYEQEQCYQFTNVANNTRKLVGERLSALRSLIDIDNINTPLKEVYESIVHLRREHKPVNSSTDSLQDIVSQLAR